MAPPATTSRASATDCVTNGFGAWTTCTKSCGTGSQKRKRAQTEVTLGGKACPHYTETRSCNAHTCAVHCTVSAFSAWTTCTKSCGTGSQNRACSVTTATRHGGYACPYLEETCSCNARTCAVHCATSAFSAWTTCTKSCGTGSQNRSQIGRASCRERV